MLFWLFDDVVCKMYLLIMLFQSKHSLTTNLFNLIHVHFFVNMFIYISLLNLLSKLRKNNNNNKLNVGFEKNFTAMAYDFRISFRHLFHPVRYHCFRMSLENQVHRVVYLFQLELHANSHLVLVKSLYSMYTLNNVREAHYSVSEMNVPRKIYSNTIWLHLLILFKRKQKETIRNDLIQRRIFNVMIFQCCY